MWMGCDSLVLASRSPDVYEVQLPIYAYKSGKIAKVLLEALAQRSSGTTHEHDTYKDSNPIRLLPISHSKVCFA